METFGDVEVATAIEDALRLSAISYDAVKHLVLARIERRVPRRWMSRPIRFCPKPMWASRIIRNYLALLQADRPWTRFNESCAMSTATEETTVPPQVLWGIT